MVSHRITKPIKDPCKKKCSKQVGASDQKWFRMFSSIPFNPLFPIFRRLIFGPSDVIAFRKYSGSAVESPTLSARFWPARPSGCPVQYTFLANQASQGAGNRSLRAKRFSVNRVHGMKKSISKKNTQNQSRAILSEEDESACQTDSKTDRHKVLWQSMCFSLKSRTLQKAP